MLSIDDTKYLEKRILEMMNYAAFLKSSTPKVLRDLEKVGLDPNIQLEYVSYIDRAKDLTLLLVKDEDWTTQRKCLDSIDLCTEKMFIEWL